MALSERLNTPISTAELQRRWRAVRAAINKAFNGDIHAFATLDRSAHEQFTTMLNVYERNLVSEESLTLSVAKEASSGERAS